VFVFSEKASMIAAIAAAIKMLVKIPRTQQYRQQSKYSLEKTCIYNKMNKKNTYSACSLFILLSDVSR